MVDRISGKTIAITGAARGIGYATARRAYAERAEAATGVLDEAQQG